MAAVCAGNDLPHADQPGAERQLIRASATTIAVLAPYMTADRGLARHFWHVATLLARRRLRKLIDTVARTPLFDAEYYREQLQYLNQNSPHSQASPTRLIEHYLMNGAWESLNPHPLFDTDFYFTQHPDVWRAGMNPLVHFIQHGRREARQPHPLFNCELYVTESAGALPHDIDPLSHFLLVGAAERRRPHALFDPRYYLAQVGKAQDSIENPLLHFLFYGAELGFNPNPLFDIDFYEQQRSKTDRTCNRPQSSRIHTLTAIDRSTSHNTLHNSLHNPLHNPLVHYVRRGARQGLKTSPLFDSGFYLARYRDVAQSNINPLEHYLRFGAREGRFATPLYAPAFLVHNTGRSMTSPAAPHSMPMQTRQPFDSVTKPAQALKPHTLFVVYGPDHVPFLKQVVLPQYLRESRTRPVELHLVNYLGNHAHFTSSESSDQLRLFDWSASRNKEHLGFGACHNFLFAKVQPSNSFVIANPDSYPMPTCLAQLQQVFEQERCGIVEARQWPAEHPKEYDPQSFVTPWSSGAFALLSSDAFRAVGGFDENFFLYTEDVDLSWRMWLAGHSVRYLRSALCTHLTGHFGYRHDRWYRENFFCARNFILIARKFFGNTGERLALRIFGATSYPERFRDAVLTGYEQYRTLFQPLQSSDHRAIRIYGFNLFHRLMSDVYPTEPSPQEEEA